MAFLALFFADLLPYSLARIETITSCSSRTLTIVGYLPGVNHNHAAALSRKRGLDILKPEAHQSVAVLDNGWWKLCRKLARA